MTEQLKAEAYVRSQRPALMELSFGCEVRTSTEGVYKLGNESYLQFWLDVDRNGLPSGWTIIGHPIQLQDWLAVLEDIGARIDYYPTQRSLPTDKDFVTCDLRYTSVSGVKVMFNLTTGQPVNESDYQTFNEITKL